MSSPSVCFTFIPISESSALIPYRPAPDYFRFLKGPWRIRTVYRDPETRLRPKHYELLFMRSVQQRVRVIERADPGVNSFTYHTHDLPRLVRMCCHLNSINAKPRPRIMCAADAPNPHQYIAAIAW